MEALETDSAVQEGVLIDSRYEVIDLISTEETQVLLRARDTALENEIIQIKVFHVDQNTKVADLTRFRKEVIITRRLSHPNIGRVYDFGKVNKELYYITLENLEGTKLSTLKNLPFNIIINIIYQLANGLIESHSQDVIHRNLSTDNVIIKIENNKLQSVHLTNFGYGRLLGDNFGLTRTGELVGSPAYMPPEQIRGEKLDVRADIYALGILAFELATGKTPFPNNQAQALQSIQLNSKIPDINSIKPDLPSWFNDLIKIATANKKEDRFLTMVEFRNFILEKLGISKFAKTYTETKKDKKINQIKNKLIKGKKILLIFIAISGLTTLTLYYLPQISNFLFATPLPNQTESLETQKTFAAVMSGDESILLESLKNGFDPQTKDNRGTPLICLASSLGHTNIIYLILEREPKSLNNTDSQNRTALIIAVQKNNKDLVELLLNHGADTSIKDSSNLTALDHAKQLKNIEIEKLLSQ